MKGFFFCLVMYPRYLIEIGSDCNIKAKIIKNISFFTGYWQKGMEMTVSFFCQYFNVWIRFGGAEKNGLVLEYQLILAYEKICKVLYFLTINISNHCFGILKNTIKMEKRLQKRHRYQYFNNLWISIEFFFFSKVKPRLKRLTEKNTQMFYYIFTYRLISKKLIYQKREILN